MENQKEVTAWFSQSKHMYFSVNRVLRNRDEVRKDL